MDEYTKYSKPLGSEDESAALFVMEMLAGDPTYAINFDRVQWDSLEERYVIIEFLLCHERQFPKGITPHTSHPNKYFHMNKNKFIFLWELSQKLGAKLYLVNYSNTETACEDQVLLMEVIKVDGSLSSNNVDTKDTKLSRKEFSDWFRELNKRGLRQIE
ncbi:MAG: hypothetical protein ACTSRG_20695 [Candidatus Helarchaeota archaeon]